MVGLFHLRQPGDRPAALNQATGDQLGSSPRVPRQALDDDRHTRARVLIDALRSAFDAGCRGSTCPGGGLERAELHDHAVPRLCARRIRRGRPRQRNRSRRAPGRRCDEWSRTNGADGPDAGRLLAHWDTGADTMSGGNLFAPGSIATALAVLRRADHGRPTGHRVAEPGPARGRGEPAPNSSNRVSPAALSRALKLGTVSS